MKFYANLHTHSNHTDGPDDPATLVRIAKEEGYKAIALTDHDVASGFAQMKQACEELGMEYIFAAEFTVQEPKAYHIVAFDFDPEYPEMKKYLEDMAIRETDNTWKCFNEGVENGNITGITWEEVLEFNKGKAWLCNNQVYDAMMAKGIAKKEDFAAWFQKNYKEQRLKYPPIRQFKTLEELVALIKAAGGIAVVAHPAGQLDDIDWLMSVGIEGMEVWHPDLSAEEKERAYAIALEKNLYISGGSDHSGLCGGYYCNCPKGMDIKDYGLYLEPCSVGTTEQYFREIKERRLMR